MLPAWPFAVADNDPDYWRAIAIPIPLSEVHSGTNTLTFKSTDTMDLGILNINLIMVAGAPVP
jgi:hypothetical protein